jgi:hypothetical protein
MLRTQKRGRGAKKGHIGYQGSGEIIKKKLILNCS